MAFVAHRARAGFAFAFLAALFTAGPAHADSYTILDLGTLGGNTSQA
jgi:hypothetical protein